VLLHHLLSPPPTETTTQQAAENKVEAAVEAGTSSSESSCSSNAAGSGGYGFWGLIFASMSASSTATKVAENDWKTMAINAATIVDTMFSSSDGTESLRQFQERIQVRLQALTTSTHFEYTASMSKKISVNPADGVSITQYAARINTSNSPVISATRYTYVENGFQQISGENIHTHGRLVLGYKFTRLDVAYINSQTDTTASVGSKINPRELGRFKNLSDQAKPSFQDYQQRDGGWLSTVKNGLVRYDHR
jgi:hypothetical protein